MPRKMLDSDKRWQRKRNRRQNDESAKTAHRHGQPWSGREEETLRQLCDIPAREGAEFMGRTVYAVITKRRDLGLDCTANIPASFKP